MSNLVELAGEPSVEDFFNRLFEIRDVVHFTHIAQPDRTLATHLALGEIYEGILPIIDGLAEGWSGVNNKQLKLSSKTVTATPDPLSYLEASYGYIMSYMPIFKHSWMKNEIDEICKILAIGLYKLKYVK